jgi:GTPase SAR1 family protein
MSGQGRYRVNWISFYAEIDGVFFVVDSTDYDRLSIVQEMLGYIAEEPLFQNREIPFLVVLNKKDEPGALENNEILDFIEFDRIKAKNTSLKWGVEDTIASRGDGVPD